MQNMSQLELRERYMQISKQLLHASEQGKPEDELDQLQQQIKELEPLMLRLEDLDAPDCP